MRQREYEKNEFIRSVIDWLGSTECYKRLLQVTDQELHELIADNSDKLEVALHDSLTQLSLSQLNHLSKQFDFGIIIVDT